MSSGSEFSNVPRRSRDKPQFVAQVPQASFEGTDLLNLLIGKTVSIAIEKDIIKSRSIIVDATHSLSRSNPYSALEVLRERSKLLQKAVYSIDEAMKGRMPEKNVSDELEKELTYCSELARCIGSDQTLSSIPVVSQKLKLLKETIEDTGKLHNLQRQRCQERSQIS